MCVCACSCMCMCAWVYVGVYVCACVYACVFNYNSIYNRFKGMSYLVYQLIVMVIFNCAIKKMIVLTIFNKSIFNSPHINISY